MDREAHMPTKATEDTQGTKQSPKELSSTLMDSTSALQAFGFNNMTTMGVTWMETLGEMGSEVLSFVADRIKEDVKTQHRLLHCSQMSEMQEIQAEFIQKAIEQYRAETGKLVEIGQKMVKAQSSGNGNS
jgi:hypothetical protein